MWVGSLSCCLLGLSSGVGFLDGFLDEGIFCGHVAENILAKLGSSGALYCRILPGCCRVRNQIVTKIEMADHFGIVGFVGVNVVRAMGVPPL